MNLFSIYHKKNIFFCENLKTAENKQHILIEERSVKENASWAQARKPGYNSDGQVSWGGGCVEGSGGCVSAGALGMHLGLSKPKNVSVSFKS